jgi:hypothetical protein
MAFIVLAGHNYQIFHCSSGYPGYLNDIQLVTNDEFCAKMATGEIMPLKQWQTKTPSGVPDVDLITTFVGGYCISDAGLPKSALYLDPTNYDWTWVQTIFVEWLESVRKDIECVFGHLKQRFRRLQNANQSHDLMDVEYCFKTCCALHNMLLRYNGHGKINNWENYDPDGLEEENYEANREEYILASSISNPHNVAFEEVSPTVPRRLVPWYLGRYNLQRDFVMKHFIQLYESGQIFWPRNFKSRQKSTMNIPAPIAARIAATAVPRNNNTLYVTRSKSFRKDLINNTYTRSIGNGLFTSVEIQANQRIIQFNGEVISVQEYHLRTARGQGGYIIQLSDTDYLDCFKTRWDNQCLASIANCALNCFDSATNRLARNNAELKAYHHSDQRGWIASLVATRRIGPQTEILWPYGSNYIYPE